jgi:hypothetical protein
MGTDAERALTDEEYQSLAQFRYALRRPGVEIEAELRLTDGGLLTSTIVLPDAIGTIAMKSLVRTVRVDVRDVKDLWRCLEIAAADGVVPDDFEDPSLEPSAPRCGINSVLEARRWQPHQRPPARRHRQASHASPRPARRNRWIGLAGACGIRSEVDAGQRATSLPEVVGVHVRDGGGAVDGDGAIAVACCHLRGRHRIDVLPGVRSRRRGSICISATGGSPMSTSGPRRRSKPKPRSERPDEHRRRGSVRAAFVEGSDQGVPLGDNSAWRAGDGRHDGPLPGPTRHLGPADDGVGDI